MSTMDIPGDDTRDPVPGGHRVRWWLWAVIGVLAMAAVLLTGLVWPGWMTAASSAPAACALLSAGRVERVLDVGQLTARERNTLYDPTTRTPIRSCTYADGAGTIVADLVVAEYPTQVGEETLLYNDASSGTNVAPVAGVGDDAVIAADLGGTANLSLLTVRASPDTLFLVTIGISNQVGPSQTKLMTLASAVLAAAL